MGIKMIHELSGNLLRKVDFLYSDCLFMFLLLAFTYNLGHTSLFLVTSPQFLWEAIHGILGEKFVLIGETGRNFNTRLTEHKRATRNGDANKRWKHNIDWDSAPCLTYSTKYFQRLTQGSWYTNLEQTPLNRCQQLPVPYKRLKHDGNKTCKRTSKKC